MGLDIRWPIGLMFSLIGVMLLVYGFGTSGNTEMYQHSLGINVNVCWGGVLVIFGGSMLAMAWRGSRKTEPGAPEKSSRPEDQVAAK
jgi:hypothetical protein